MHVDSAIGACTVVIASPGKQVFPRVVADRAEMGISCGDELDRLIDSYVHVAGGGRLGAGCGGGGG